MVMTAGSVTVLAKHSRDLRIGTDKPIHADRRWIVNNAVLPVVACFEAGVCVCSNPVNVVLQGWT